MAKDKNVLEAIEKYTDHRTSELFHYDGVERVEYGYSRLFFDVENEPGFDRLKRSIEVLLGKIDSLYD